MGGPLPWLRLPAQRYVALGAQPLQNRLLPHPRCGRVMDRRFGDRAIHSQLARPRDPRLSGQLGGPVIEQVQGLRLDGLRQAQERGRIGDPPKIFAREPAQDQTIGDPLQRLLVALSIQVLDIEQAQNDFGRRGVPSMHSGQSIASDQIGPDRLEQGVIIEQAIELEQHRIGLAGQFRDADKDVFRRVSGHEHSTFLHRARGSRSFYQLDDL